MIVRMAKILGKILLAPLLFGLIESIVARRISITFFLIVLPFSVLAVLYQSWWDSRERRRAAPGEPPAGSP